MENNNHPDTDASRTTNTKHKKKRSLRLLPIIATILVLILAAATIVFYKKYENLKNNPQVAANQQTESLVNEVDKLLQLPTDEKPTVATVEDKSKLKDQPFFASVEKGDKILIYTNARKAIIYRPSTKKIINVGPIAINSSEQQNTKQ